MSENHIYSDSRETNQSFAKLLDGTVAAIGIGTSGGSDDKQRTIFPGAFNPLHDGHLMMAVVAERVFGMAVEFELSIANVDKPMLDLAAVESRLSQFADDQLVWLTTAATFGEKSDLFRCETFVVGADTIVRIADPTYYDDDPEKCDAAISRIIENDCRFLVFGRTMEKGFMTLREIGLPDVLLGICTEIPEAVFRQDISSSTVREGRLEGS